MRANFLQELLEQLILTPLENRLTFPVALARAALTTGLLLLWTAFGSHSGCVGTVAINVILAAIIAAGGIEYGLLRRRAWVGMYLRLDSQLYRLLRGGLVIITLEIAKALLIALILLLQALFWPLWIWLALGLDVVIFVALHQALQRRLHRHVQAGFSGMLTRAVLLRVHTIALTLVISVGLFLTPAYDYGEFSLLKAIEHGATLVRVPCPWLETLIHVIAAWNTFGWWLTQHTLAIDAIRPLAIFAWLVFLLASATFTWGWTRLLAGTLLQPGALSRLLCDPVERPSSGESTCTIR